MDNIIPKAIYNTTVVGYETDGTTVRNPSIGLSTYQILPKIKSFSLVGFSSGTAGNILAGINSSIALTDYNWGKANFKNHYY